MNIHFTTHKLNNINMFHSQSLNKVLFKGLLGSFSMYMPSLYFIKKEAIRIAFIFLSKFNYLSFLAQMKVILKKLNSIFFAKFRLKGLGFRTINFSYSLMYFFFNYSNYIYFYRPRNIFLKRFKKRFVLLSNDWFLLRQMSVMLLLLKKKGPYNLRGIKSRRQIYLLKKSGKSI